MSLDTKKNSIERLKRIATILEVFIKGSPHSNGLFEGWLGIILFFAYYSRYTKATYDEDLFVQLASKYVNDLGEIVDVNHTYCNGLAGILSALNHLKQHQFIDIDLSAAADVYDDYLYHMMTADMNAKNYDLLHGSIGVGLYFIRTKEDLEKYVTPIIESLMETGIKENNTIRWRSKYNIYNREVVNISLSHGMSSIIIFLAKIIKRGILSEKIVQLLTSAVDFVLSQEIDRYTCCCMFPSISLESDLPLKRSRLAWCYGDLGVATALFHAGHAIKNAEWINKSMDIFLFATSRRELTDNGVFDISICHGTSGIAQIFRRMYLNTREVKFQQTQRYWVDNTVSLLDTMPLSNDSISNFNLINGMAGVGLSLLSYIYDEEESSNWDELLLLS